MMATDIQHGTSTASRNGCRCVICREANTKRVNEWRWKTGKREKGRKPSYDGLRLARLERIAEYEKHPARCKRCGKVIPYDRRADAHCSVSCARRNERAIEHAKSIAKLGGDANGRKRRALVTDSDFAINVRLSTYRGAARKRGFVFELSRDQFVKIILEDCWYCGRPPQTTWRKTKRESAPNLNGIDRVDNAKGYTVENSVPCCGPCNRAKHTLGCEEFVALAKLIAARH
jgi:hypothetical protein